MKQEVNISIEKLSVWTELEKHTGYEGAKVNETLYDRVRIKTNDRTALERWWCDACSMLTTLLAPYVSNVTEPSISDVPDEDDSFSLSLSMPGNWNEVYLPMLESTLYEIVTDYMLQQWYQVLTVDAQVKAASDRLTAATVQLQRMLLARKRPTRPTY